ncbi:Zinc finger C2H2 superfamily [Sergentomyia squamirostris]
MSKAKKKIPTVKPYGKENLKRALEAIRDVSTIRQASQTFRVPKSIMQTKLSGKYPENCRNGRSTRSSEIEESLVGVDTWMSVILLMMEFYSKRSSPGLEDVQILCKIMNLSNNVTDGRPGDKWFRNFLVSHPQDSNRKPQSFSVARAIVTADDRDGSVFSVLEKENKSK